MYSLEQKCRDRRWHAGWRWWSLTDSRASFGSETRAKGIRRRPRRRWCDNRLILPTIQVAAEQPRDFRKSREASSSPHLRPRRKSLALRKRPQARALRTKKI